MASLNFGTLHATITANSTQYTKTINEMQQTTAAAMAAIAKSIEAATNQIGKSVPTPNLSSTINQMKQMEQAAAASLKLEFKRQEAAEAAITAGVAKAAKAREVVAAADNAAAVKSSVADAKAFVKRFEAEEAASVKSGTDRQLASEALIKADYKRKAAATAATVKANEAAATAEAASIRAGAVKLLASIKDGVKDRETATKAESKRHEAAVKAATPISDQGLGLRQLPTPTVVSDSGLGLNRQAATVAAAASTLESAGETAKRSFSEVAAVIGSEVMAVGRVFYDYLTKPLIDFGNAALVVGNKFELTMSRIVGLAGVAKDVVDDWGKKVIALGPQLGKSPQELAEGLYFVASSGFKGAAALDVLTTSGKAAAAGLGQTKVVADTITSAVNSYGQANLSAARTGDALVAGVREGKSEIDQFAGSIGRVMPYAKALGVDLYDVVAAMAAQTRTGTTARQAAVGLIGLFSALDKPIVQAKAHLSLFKNELGKPFNFHQLREMAKEAGGIFKVMKTLEHTFKDDEEAFGRTFGDIRPLRTIRNLLAQDAGVVQSVFDNVRKSVGDVDVAFEVWLSTNASKFEMAWAKIQAALIVVGMAISTTLIPALNSVSQSISNVLKWFMGLDQSTQKTVVAWAAWVAAIGPIIIGLALIAKAIAFVTTALYLKVTALVALKLALFALPILVIGSSIVEIASQFMGAAKAVDEFNKALLHSGKIQSEVIGVRQKRFDRELKAALDISNPRERVKSLESQLEQAKKELGGADNTVAKAKEGVNQAGGIGNNLLGLVPGVVGKGFRMEMEKAAGDLKNAEDNAKSFKTHVNNLTTALEEAKLAAKGVEGDWIDPMLSIALNDTTEKLQFWARTLKMSRGEVEVYKLQLLGLKDTQLGGVRAWASYLEALEKQKKELEHAKQVIKDIQSPQEKFQAQVKELDYMLKNNLLTVEQYAKAFAKAKNEMAGATKEVHSFNAATSNSNEALDRIQKWRDRMNVAMPDIAAAIARKKELGGPPVEPSYVEANQSITKKRLIPGAGVSDEDGTMSKAKALADMVKKAVGDIKDLLPKAGPDKEGRDAIQAAKDKVDKAEDERVKTAMQAEDAQIFANKTRNPSSIDTSDKSVFGRLGNLFATFVPILRDPKHYLSSKNPEAEEAAKTTEAAAKKAEEALQEAKNEAEITNREVERKTILDEKVKALQDKLKKDKESLIPKDKDIASLTEDKGNILDILKSIAATNAAMAKKNNMEIEPANLVA